MEIVDERFVFRLEDLQNIQSLHTTLHFCYMKSGGLPQTNLAAEILRTSALRKTSMRL